MNILIPNHWLHEYLETCASPAEIQKEVSLCGPSIERIYDKDGDQVFDIEITTNRVDSMCVRGIAREASVILNQAGYKSIFKPYGENKNFNLDNLSPTQETLPLPKIIIKTDKVKRVMCLVLDQVKHTATPDWMGERLIQIEENIHNSIIDITNYITHELGHPCHAFDYDKIMALGGEIIITKAKAGKKFVTLDGNEYETLGNEVVFENPQGEIIDLPAIKGTLNSAIDDNTTRVLFWLENLDAMTVRKASMGHGIRTIAATLNEKGVDPYLASDVLVRGSQLYKELCGAKFASSVFDYFPTADQPLPQVTLRFSRLGDYLGITIPHDEVISILTHLDMEVIDEGEKLLVTPPTFRGDVRIEADLIEEVARIYGYHRLPSTLNFSTVVIPAQNEYAFTWEDRIKQFLAALGYFEVYTYSMISEKQALTTNIPLENYLKLTNPLTSDKVYLRQSLFASLDEVFVINNLTSKIPTSIFEIAKTYFSDPQNTTSPVREEMNFTLLSNKTYREVLTDLHDLLATFYINDLQVIETTSKQPNLSQQADLMIGQQKIGALIIDQENKVGMEIKLATLLKFAKLYPHYKPLSHYASIVEDLTFVIPKNLGVGTVLELIKAQSPLLKAVTFKDQFKRNFTFTLTYQSHDHQLSNEEIAPLRKKIVDSLKKQNVDLVGKLLDK